MYTTITEILIDRPDLTRTMRLDSPLAREVMGIDSELFCEECDRFGGYFVQKVRPRPIPLPTLFDHVRMVAKGHVARL